MDSDEEVPDEAKPSTSSAKRSKPLTAAERKRRSRSAQHVDDRDRKTPLTPAERKRKSREAKSADGKREESAQNRGRMATQRAYQSADGKKEEYAKNRRRIATQRAAQSADGRREANIQARGIRSRQRTNVDYKEALRSQDIMEVMLCLTLRIQMTV